MGDRQTPERRDDDQPIILTPEQEEQIRDLLKREAKKAQDKRNDDD